MSEKDILYLESDEEIPSIIDKIKNSKNENILFVVPKASIVLQSVINLKLIKKIASRSGKKISIVSHDQSGRMLAQRVNIPVFETTSSKSSINKIEDTSSVESPQEELKSNQLENKNEKFIERKDVVVHHFQDDEVIPEYSHDTQNIKEIERDDSSNSENLQENEELENTQEKVDEDDQPKKPKKKRAKKIITILSLVIIALLVVILFVPRAKVTLGVKGEEFENSVDLTIGVEQKQVDFEKTIVPGQKYAVTKEKQGKFEATGEKNIGEKARGKVTFSNLWSTEDQNIVAGTKLEKDGKAFQTKSSIIVPGASLALKEGKVVTNPGKITGEIEAAEAGEDYNVDSGKFLFSDYQGERQQNIFAESTSKLTGGSTRTVKVISQSDIELAKESLRKGIEEENIKELKDEIKGTVLLDGAVQTETQEAKSNLEVGAEVSEFEVTVKAQSSAISFSESSYRDVFLKKINEKVPQDKDLIINETNQLVTTVSSFSEDKKQMIVKGTLKSQLGPKIDDVEIKNSISGKSITDAEKLIKENKEIQSVSIELNPNILFNNLPFSGKQITIEVRYE